MTTPYRTPGERDKCAHCQERPVCYPGAVFCGAACTAEHESKRRGDHRAPATGKERGE